MKFCQNAILKKNIFLTGTSKFSNIYASSNLDVREKYLENLILPKQYIYSISKKFETKVQNCLVLSKYTKGNMFSISEL